MCGNVIEQDFRMPPVLVGVLNHLKSALDALETFCVLVNKWLNVILYLKASFNAYEELYMLCTKKLLLMHSVFMWGRQHERKTEEDKRQWDAKRGGRKMLWMVAKIQKQQCIQ